MGDKKRHSAIFNIITIVILTAAVMAVATRIFSWHNNLLRMGSQFLASFRNDPDLRLLCVSFIAFIMALCTVLYFIQSEKKQPEKHKANMLRLKSLFIAVVIPMAIMISLSEIATRLAILGYISLPDSVGEIAYAVWASDAAPTAITIVIFVILPILFYAVYRLTYLLLSRKGKNHESRKKSWL